VNHGLDLEERLENLVITGACLSSNEERVVLYENRRESRDLIKDVWLYQHNRHHVAVKYTS